MTTAAARTEGTLDGVKSVLRSIWAAFLTAALTVSFVISFTTIIYGGSLAPLLETGLGLSLLGAALMCAVGGFFYSFRGTICHPQDVTAIVLAVSASAMAETWPADQGDSLMATIAMLIAVTTAFSGLVAWGFGVLRLGFLARFIPYPVIGGFLAATGYLLLTGAIGLGLGARVTVWTLAPLLEPATLVQWLPWVLIGGGIAIGGAPDPQRPAAAAGPGSGARRLLCHPLRQWHGPAGGRRRRLAARPLRHRRASSRCSPPRWSSTPTPGPFCAPPPPSWSWRC